MGLDMFLTGERYLQRVNKPSRRIGDLKGELIDLGYWRKHPNLHGFIVQTFASGEDDCQRIELDTDAIQQIIAAVQAQTLPETSGFFFGESDGSEKELDLLVFRNALAWLQEDDEEAWRSVYYQASW